MAYVLLCSSGSRAAGEGLEPEGFRLAAWLGSEFLMEARHSPVEVRNGVGGIVFAKGFRWRTRRAGSSVPPWSG